MNRRDFLKGASAASALGPRAGVLYGTAETPATTMGIVEYSFVRNPHSKSTYKFLDFCHSFGVVPSRALPARRIVGAKRMARGEIRRKGSTDRRFCGQRQGPPKKIQSTPRKLFKINQH
jgi:hypothetical protein